MFSAYICVYVSEASRVFISPSHVYYDVTCVCDGPRVRGSPLHGPACATAVPIWQGVVRAARVVRAAGSLRDVHPVPVFTVRWLLSG